jgi:hypothetical protein
MRLNRTCALMLALAMQGLVGMNSVHAAATYTFESLTPGTLAGQDNWQLAIPEALWPDVGGGSGTNSSKIIYRTTNGKGSIVTRTNDANFSFPHFSGNETNAVIKFDAFLGSVNPGIPNMEAAFGLGHGSNFGPVFGENAGSGPGGNFFTILQPTAGGFEYDAPIPASVSAGDWVQFAMTMDFTANSGDGAGSLSYQDLTTRGPLTAVAALQNVNLKLSSLPAGAGPATWDEMYLRLDNGTAGTIEGADNLVPNANAPEPASTAVLALATIGLLGRRRKA